MLHLKRVWRCGQQSPHLPCDLVYTAELSSSPEKKRRSDGIDLASPPSVNPESAMVVIKGAVREAMAEEVVGMMTEIMASQPDVLEGYILEPELAEVVKRLLGYLQPVVTLMATMVPLTEESRLWDKRGREALDQGVSMVLLVSVLFSAFYRGSKLPY